MSDIPQSHTIFAQSLAEHTDRSRLDLDRIPGPNPMPLLGWAGNAVRFFRNPVDYVHQLKHGGYGNIVMFSRGMKRGLVLAEDKCPGALFLFGNEYNRQTLIQDVFEGGVLMAPQGLGGASKMSTSLPWMAGAKHSQQRRLIFPSYHHRRVSEYRDVMVRATERAFDRWQIGEPIAMMKESVRFLAEFESAMVLGIGETPGGHWATLWERYYKFFIALTNPAAQVIPFNLPFTPRRTVIEHGNEIWNEFDRLVTERRAHNDPKAIDLLSVLIHGRYEDGTALTHHEIVAEAAQLYLAGWATTRGPIAWISLLLAMHPKVHADLHDELTSVLHGDAPTMEQLKQLPLLDAVVKEGLRILPPIHFVTRVPQRPVEIAGYQIPAMTECYTSIYETHRDPDVFPEPNRFKPERWETADPGPYGYLPYGIGERSCIGIALANMQLRIFFAMLVQRYRLEVPENSKVDHSGFILLPTPDLQLRVRKQDRDFNKSRAKLRGGVTRSVNMDM